MSAADTVLTPPVAYNRLRTQRPPTDKDDDHGSDDRRRGLRKRFGPTLALDGMTFTVRPGQVTGFVGPNGAGKSTTMRVILGLDAPDAGTALVGGRPYREPAPPADASVGSLLDAAALQPSRTGRNHLLWLAHSQGLAAGRVDEVLEQAGLDKAARRRAGGYSLGMRQRLGIAAALLGDPPVLMLDEPFNGMDPEGIVWMRGLPAVAGRRGPGGAGVQPPDERAGRTPPTTWWSSAGAGSSPTPASRDLLAAASGDRVTLRTTAPDRAAAALARAGRGHRRGRHRHADGVRARRREGRGRCWARTRCRSPRCRRTAPRWRRPTWSSPATRSSTAPRTPRGQSPMSCGGPMTATMTRLRPPGRAGQLRAAAARRVDQVPHRARLGDRHGGRRGADRRGRAVRRVRAAGRLPAGQLRRPDRPARTVPAVRPVGPGGEAVTDSFYFVHQPLRRRRQHHRPGDLADRPLLAAGRRDRARAGPGAELRHRHPALGQGRDHHHARAPGRGRRTRR